MIIGCNKTNTKNLEQELNNSCSLSESNERSSSVPIKSRTTKLIQTHHLCNDLKKTAIFHRQESTPHPKGQFDLNQIGNQKYSTNQSNPKEELSPEKEEDEDDDQPLSKLKSNGSVKSLRGKNYVLKSDICKSTKTKSNFCVSYQEENPWLNYYGGIVNKKSLNNNQNDYYNFLVTKPKEKLKLDFNTNNYFPPNSSQLKEILVDNTYDAWEDETVSVDVPLVFPSTSMNTILNNSNNNNSNSSFTDSPSPSTGKQQQIPSQPLPNFPIPNKLNRNLTQNNSYQPINNNIIPITNQTNNTITPTYMNYINNNNCQNPYNSSQMKMNIYPYQNYASSSPQIIMQYSPYQSYHDMNYNNTMHQQFNQTGIGNEMQLQGNTNNNLLNTSMSSTYTNTNNLRRTAKLLNNNNYSNFSDEVLAQYASSLIREQSGCRFVQEKVIADPQFGNNILFHYIKEDLNELICDAFGNYLFQVLIDILTPENLIELLRIITPFFYQICISPHGTRVIQKILDKIYTTLPLVLLFKENLSYNLISICKDPYGNHIIQKYLVVIQNPHKQFIYDCIYSHFLEISNTKHGCCIIQKCLSEGSKDQRSKLFLLIHQYLYDLITDQFGNYTIQYIFSCENPLDIQAIINDVLGNILGLCKQKYSSNVLEKCFENSNIEIQQLIIKELIKNDTIISELIADSYGNYVIQKALLVAKEDHYIKILTVIASSVSKIKKHSFGSKLIAKLLVTHKDLNALIANVKKDNNGNEYHNEGNIYSACNYSEQNNQTYKGNNSNGTWNNSNQKKKKKPKDKKSDYKR